MKDAILVLLNSVVVGRNQIEKLIEKLTTK